MAANGNKQARATVTLKGIEIAFGSQKLCVNVAVVATVTSNGF